MEYVWVVDFMSNYYVFSSASDAFKECYKSVKAYLEETPELIEESLLELIESYIDDDEVFYCNDIISCKKTKIGVPMIND